MYLWDSNILRYFGTGHPQLTSSLQQVSWSEIGLPSVVVAEVLCGRCDFALKALPEQAPFAYAALASTLKLLNRFNTVVFNEEAAEALKELQQRHKAHKRYADLQIAAMAKAGGHVVVTRNLKHFKELLPRNQLANWIDDGG